MPGGVSDASRLAPEEIYDKQKGALVVVRTLWFHWGKVFLELICFMVSLGRVRGYSRGKAQIAGGQEEGEEEGQEGAGHDAKDD